MRFSCYKAPGEIQVKIVESSLINIGLVRLFGNDQKLAVGLPNNNCKKLR